MHCAEDSLFVMKVMEEVSGIPNDGERLVAVSKLLTGIPLQSPSDNDSIGTIYVNFHGLDRLGFVNNSLALMKASGKQSPLFRDYINALESVSRRKGVDDGFVSQHFYGAEWVVDNVFRGNLEERTEYDNGGGFKTKTLDYISRHPEEFPALKDSVNLEKIKTIELGFRSHRIPHLKKQSAGNKTTHEQMKAGDIIIMLSPEPDRDIYDIGIIDMKDGVPYMVHISTVDGVVTEDPYPINRLFKLENQHFYGYRWLRPVE